MIERIIFLKPRRYGSPVIAIHEGPYNAYLFAA